MKKCIIAVILAAILFGTAGYVTGGYYAAAKTAKMSNYATLMWLTNIDESLERGNIERAKELVFLATDGTFGALHIVDHIPGSVLMTAMPFDSFNIKDFNERTATKAKLHFADRAVEFSGPAKEFFDQIQEIDLSSGARSKANEG